ncbi:hypothetical protein GCM10007938_06960 [Vibrio zhanjiangensis]|uniref:Uncharacterized protein n=1 Tax=Vibrio zhanjiangensis TaxID=1046128 RepID=A0ABQ6EV72_9VIBR|nr:hypothetical protein [Vibrio zhanjiangensis]GLT16919.1 hypothetical protein GCM10007938_06960 [Vibrio zhanjiangensis]
MNNIVLNFRAKVCNSTSSAIELGRKTGDFSLAKNILKVKQDSNTKKSITAHTFRIQAENKSDKLDKLYQKFGYDHHDTKTYGVSKHQHNLMVRINIANDTLKKAEAKVDKYNLRDTELQHKAKQLNDARIDFKNNIELVSGQDLINESGINILNKYNASDIRDLKS